MSILQIMLLILLVSTFLLMVGTSLYAFYCEFISRQINKNIVKIIITSIIVLSLFAIILAIIQF